MTLYAKKGLKYYEIQKLVNNIYKGLRLPITVFKCMYSNNMCCRHPVPLQPFV